MSKLTTLRKLDLSENNVVELPKDPDFFKRMEKLEFLVLENNLIDWPDSVKGLSGAAALKYLSLKGNPVEQAPDLMYRFEIVKKVP